ncbi:hypothetical protein N752_03695 [Desulforamulus aquiferis]|nr:hypothetical protein [Desulforamulus aquiferis]RYD06439.1 hypothetical protein N752_03695 [Desulforamulus aquiferis]
MFARDILFQGPEGFGGLVSALGAGSLAGAIGLVILSGKQYQLKFLWSGAVGLAVFELFWGLPTGIGWLPYF